jgi:hypothetical protein
MFSVLPSNIWCIVEPTVLGFYLNVQPKSFENIIVWFIRKKWFMTFVGLIFKY